MRDGVSARELFELQKLGGRYGRFIGMHFRYTPGDDTTEANGIQEMLANAAALGDTGHGLPFQQSRIQYGA